MDVIRSGLEWIVTPEINKKKVAIAVPPILVGGMVIVFQILSRTLGETLGWYLGLVFYWLVWGAAFPLWLIGRKKILKIVQPRRINRGVILLLTIPILGASLNKLIPGMNYRSSDMWIFLMMISTAFGNGFFEEVLWRGVYMELFPQRTYYRIVWPGLWFALWHYAPGSVSGDGNVIALMVGSGFMGFYLSILAKKTNTIWWGIVAHTIGGIIMCV
jgi:membrane protease YdiL (CAAX protease family)